MSTLFAERIETDRLALEMVTVSHADGTERSRRAVEKHVERGGGQHEGRRRNLQASDDGSAVDVHRDTTMGEQYETAVAEGRA